MGNKLLKIAVKDMELPKKKQDFVFAYHPQIMEYIGDILDFQKQYMDIERDSEDLYQKVNQVKNNPFQKEILLSLYTPMSNLYNNAQKATELTVTFAEDECYKEASKVVLDDLLKSDGLLKKYGMSNLPSKRKSHAKKNGYIAEHATIQSEKNPDYFAEIQAKSSYRYEIAKYGLAAHDTRAGKARKLPPLKKAKKGKFTSKQLLNQRKITPVYGYLYKDSNQCSIPSFIVQSYLYNGHTFHPKGKYGVSEDKNYVEYVTNNNGISNIVLKENLFDLYDKTNFFDSPYANKNEEKRHSDHYILKHFLEDYYRSNDFKDFNQKLEDYYTGKDVTFTSQKEQKGKE